jgi:ferredoxin
MHVLVDRDRCEANQVCMRLVPEVFFVDERDQLQLLVETVDVAWYERLRRAVRACPKQALALIEMEEKS